MTRTAPWRRMILHFSHIGFTDGRTFMVPFQVFGPVTRSGCRGSSRCYVTDGAHAGGIAHARTVEDSKGNPVPSGGELFARGTPDSSPSRGAARRRRAL